MSHSLSFFFALIAMCVDMSDKGSGHFGGAVANREPLIIYVKQNDVSAPCTKLFEVAFVLPQQRVIGVDDVNRFVVKARQLNIDDFAIDDIAEQIAKPVSLYQAFGMPNQLHHICSV